jgi:hypothetical protein
MVTMTERLLDRERRALLSDATVLINEGIEIDGHRIWGSPVTPLYGGAFGLISPEDRKRLYARIPEDTDSLITQGPPYGILDVTPGSVARSFLTRCSVSTLGYTSSVTSTARVG